MDETFVSKINFSGLHDTVAKIKSEVAKIIIGQDDAIKQLIIAILADGHVLIEGVPGVAKTLMAKVLAKTVECKFSRIQFTPDLMPADIIGTSIFNAKINDFEFKQGPVFSNFVLIDEINRAPAKTQSALFEVMEERQISVDGNSYKMQPPFIVFATQNPIEHEGTYRLPEAEIDRFLLKVKINYPTMEQETDMLLGLHQREFPETLVDIQTALSKDSLLHYRQLIRNIHIEPDIAKYITAITTGTRKSRDIYLGASPRASLAILNGAKALAAIQGRDFVIPDDVQEIVFPALSHRIILTAEKEMEGVSPEDVLHSVIGKIEVPR